MGAAEPLRSVLWVKRQRCAVSLDPARALLRWWRSPGPGAGAPGADACSVPVSEIITVEETDIHGRHYGRGKWQKMEKPFAFTVHCVKRARRHRWRWAQVTFCCAEEPVCHLWLQTLRELLEKLSPPAAERLARSKRCLWYSAFHHLIPRDVTSLTCCRAGDPRPLPASPSTRAVPLCESARKLPPVRLLPCPPSFQTRPPRPRCPLPASSARFPETLSL
uniref:Ceramide kinase PH domain-containing protein n=1 Tax=Panthera leo TaxID=9689 RepID=A0A8C8Y8V7_PANLE